MRVLFVVREYLPKPMPPGICVMNVQKALYNIGIPSDVIMVGEKEGKYSDSEYGEVFSIEGTINYEIRKQNKIKWIISRIPLLLCWPVAFPERVGKYRRIIDKLQQERKYNAIIGTLYPVDVAVACSKYNHFFLYEMDSLTNNPTVKGKLKQLFKHRLRFVEKLLFSRSELIIHLNHNKDYYMKDEYKKYEGKSVYTDIPNLKKRTYDITKSNSNKKTLMVYAGLLNHSYRSPEMLLSILEKLSEKRDIECLFFSRGDCENIIREYQEKTNGAIKAMGYVSQKELEDYYDKTNVLLDIGNKLSGEDRSLPSKIFDYFSIGKPIIHIKGTNDAAIDYFNKYSLSLILDETNTIDENVETIIRFLNQTIGKQIEYETIKSAFPENTPEYTANIIASKIVGQND